MNNYGTSFMAQPGQAASMQEPFRVLLYKALCSAAKVRIHIIEKKNTKTQGDINLLDEATKMLRNAPFYTDNESQARKFICERRDFIERVFPPTHLKKLDRILLSA